MQKFKYSEKFFGISFSDKISKQAYLKACKWLAVNVWGKEELSKYVTASIRKNSSYTLPTFDVDLYITMDGHEKEGEYCQKCRSLHTVMYSIDRPECGTCRLRGCMDHMHGNIKSLVSFWKEAFENEEKI